MDLMANAIRSLRLKKGLTQAQMADGLGVRYQTVSKWETGVTLPDTAMLPALADLLDVSIDGLFGRRANGCAGSVGGDSAEFLLRTYSRMYAPEAGPWNLSVENKYLEYRFAHFFERNFSVPEAGEICNIGIGAGMWDTYLSYKLKKGSLTSVDRLEICCRQLEERLRCEGNPHSVTVVCADAMELDMDGRFDLVTMVGSTVQESGVGLALFGKACRLVKAGGALYYQSMDETEDCNEVLGIAWGQGMVLSALLEDEACGLRCRYYKFSKQ